MILIPIDVEKEKIVKTMCELRNKKVAESKGCTMSHENSYKEVWNNQMTERQKGKYTFKQIYEYMINS